MYWPHTGLIHPSDAPRPDVRNRCQHGVAVDDGCTSCFRPPRDPECDSTYFTHIGSDE